MTNDFNVSLDVSNVVTDLLDRFMGLFGRDRISLEAQAILERQLRIAVNHASWVKIVGMDQPVSIFKIYQPTRLRNERMARDIDFGRLLRNAVDAVILGGPGRGKTILMHYLFATLASKKQKFLPWLVTLRWPNAISDLESFVEHLVHRRIRPKTDQRAILLVDGYDEISWEDRKRVDEVLRAFGSLKLGTYYLTCRLFYDVSDVKAEHYVIAPFTREDSVRYVEAFADAYSARLVPSDLLSELDEHGFGDFASHPLMLAMICILKSGPVPRLPRNSIGVIRRAIDTLTFRWDQSRKIHRHSDLPLDGEDRVRCLMLIAHEMRQLVESDIIVRRACEQYLRLAQWSDVNASMLLDEIAQWYGILVPAGGNQWSFVHRTIHDFLAARFWVESGRFSAATVATFDARSAYAAALSPDATSYLTRALLISREIHAFVECISNSAMFEPRPVARAVAEHFKKFPEAFSWRQAGNSVYLSTTQDFFGSAGDDLLEAMAAVGLEGATPADDLVCAYSLAELRRRERAIPPAIAAAWTGRYRAARKTYQIERGSGIIRVR